MSAFNIHQSSQLSQPALPVMVRPIEYAPSHIQGVAPYVVPDRGRTPPPRVSHRSLYDGFRKQFSSMSREDAVACVNQFVQAYNSVAIEYVVAGGARNEELVLRLESELRSMLSAFRDTF